MTIQSNNTGTDIMAFINTLVVRSVMRAHGADVAYTNMLKNGNRTVKCNIPNTSSGGAMKREIRRVMREHGHEVVAIRLHDFGVRRSVIVELPRV
jgi:hypothetical protein